MKDFICKVGIGSLIRKRLALLGCGIILSGYALSAVGSAEAPAPAASSRQASELGAAGVPEQTTLYGIGSISKVFTTAAVLKLSEEGALDLDTPLVQYLPEFVMQDSRYREITPRMLLNHSSGLQGSYYKNAMLLGEQSTYNHDTILEHLKGQRLKADPGAFSVYCNDGFTLAELLVERISGMDFTQYMKETFFQKLGTDRIETSQSAFNREELASVYWNQKVKLPYENTSVIGSGGLYATAEDLCRFGQMFTASPVQELLTADSVILSETPAFQGGAWKETSPDGASMAYGLGWDTVNAYPFGKYGIKAVTKGGDTIGYHASMTVLPEEGISCAVLSSGGSGSFCEIAVQEILLEYLKETGRLPEEKQQQAEPETAAVPLEPGVEKQAGWYVSMRQAVEVSFEPDGMLILRSAGSKRDSTQQYRHIGEGVFQSTEGAYLSPEGRLVEAAGGTTGITLLSFETDEAGTSYLMVDTTERSPGLGETHFSVPGFQKAEPNQLESKIEESWKPRFLKRYYLVSEMSASSFYLQNPSTRLMQMDGLPGYVCLEEGGPASQVDRIADEDSARFFQTIPGQAGRDLNDIQVETAGGAEYLDTQSFRFIGEEAVSQLPQEGTVTIPETGETLWFAAEGDGKTEYILTAPETGSFFVYEETADGLKCTASSQLGNNGTEIYLPVSCKIAFAGEAGAEFQVLQKEKR